MRERYRYFLKGRREAASLQDRMLSLEVTPWGEVAASSRLNAGEANSPVAFVGTVKSDR